MSSIEVKLTGGPGQGPHIRPLDVHAAPFSLAHDVAGSPAATGHPHDPAPAAGGKEGRS